MRLTTTCTVMEVIVLTIFVATSITFCYLTESSSSGSIETINFLKENWNTQFIDTLKTTNAFGNCNNYASYTPLVDIKSSKFFDNACICYPKSKMENGNSGSVKTQNFQKGILYEGCDLVDLEDYQN